MTSIIVERHIEEVFAFITDARNNPLWQSAAGLWETCQLPDGPVGVGTQITETWHFMGMKAQSTTEVTEYEPGRRYARHLLAGSRPITRETLVFEPVADGTRWTSTALIEVNGVVPVPEPVLVAHLERAMKTSVAEAKRLLERRIVDSAR